VGVVGPGPLGCGIGPLLGAAPGIGIGALAGAPARGVPGVVGAAATSSGALPTGSDDPSQLARRNAHTPSHNAMPRKTTFFPVTHDTATRCFPALGVTLWRNVTPR
jgi:hypothetical protein